jgi:predicted phage replisome organizer
MWKNKGSDKLAEVKWIKIITGIFDDEKIQLIEQMPDSDTFLVIWFKLLCLAGKTNNHGIIMLSDKIPYTDEMLSTIFRRPLNTVRLALKTFENFGMIEIVDGIVTITNWEKHQSGDKLESIREYNRLAKQNERERKKKLLCQGNVIDSQGTDIEVDIEVDKDIDNKENIEKTPDRPATSSTNENKTTLEQYLHEKEATEKKKFHPPTLGEIIDYCRERKSQGHKNNVDAERFIDYYTSKGWMIGKNKMKDWKAAVRTWERSDYNAGRIANGKGNNEPHTRERQEESRPKYGHIV